MFWVELYLILQMASWFVNRLELDFSTGERNALVVFSGLGIKSVLLFAFITMEFTRLIASPSIFTIVVCLSYFVWTKVRLSDSGKSLGAQLERKGLCEFSGSWVLLVLLILGLVNVWFFPITGADGIWHHVKGMVYGLPLVDFESKQIISQFRQYPPLIGLLYGWLISAGFERITIIFPILYLCLLFVVYYRVLEHAESSTVAGIATLLVGTTPYLWWHSFLPFLDWTAGVFYAVGILYWFSLIKNILGSAENIDKNQNKSLAVLSGFLFGLASLTRPEFILYSALPLFLLVCVFDRGEEPVNERIPVIARFAIAAFIFPSLWFAVLLNFNGPLDSTFKQLIIGCSLLWLGLGLVLSGMVRFTPRVSAVVGIFAVIVCFTGLFFILPAHVSPWTALAVRLFRLLTSHIFFAGTVFLMVFLFTERLRQLTPAEKTLGILLLSFLLAQFFIYAYAGLKWPTLSQYINNTFLFPGNSINLSDTRGTIAFYPIFIFFIFCLPKIRNSINSGWVRRLLFSIVAINLTFILVVFAGPRIKFMVDNFEKSHEQLTETSGPLDLPNQFAKTYQVAHQLRKHVVRGQSLFLPPSTREGSFRSVMTQVLFWQKLTFSDDPFFKINLEREGSHAHAVGRYGRKGELCYGMEGKSLGDTGFVLCQLDD